MSGNYVINIGRQLGSGGKEIQTEKVNTILKNISVHCFCTANQSSFF